MGDHFVLLMDRLLTESTLEAAIESRNRLMQAATSLAVDDTKFDKSLHKVEFGDISTSGKLVECRICQDEDLDSNMETPCSCCGSLKYAHRRCVQRWCNEKGNTMCEICHQQFKPGYTAPPPLFHIGQIPMNFRGNWETSQRNLPGPRFIAVVSNDRNILNPEYDEYSASTTRSVICCRLVAVVFMILLILRNTLPLIFTETNDITFPLLMLIFLRIAGVILPIYVIVKAVTSLQHRRHQEEPPNSPFASSDEEDPNSPFASSDEEADNSTLHAQPHVINVE